jgi:hypothetical protein
MDDLLRRLLDEGISPYLSQELAELFLEQIRERTCVSFRYNRTIGELLTVISMTPACTKLALSDSMMLPDNIEPLVQLTFLDGARTSVQHLHRTTPNLRKLQNVELATPEEYDALKLMTSLTSLSYKQGNIEAHSVESISIRRLRVGALTFTDTMKLPNLQRFSLDAPDDTLVTSFHTPMISVETVRISNKNVVCLDAIFRVFPHVQSISLYNASYFIINCVQPYTKMKSLSITNCGLRFTPQVLVDLQRCMPRLRNLSVLWCDSKYASQYCLLDAFGASRIEVLTVTREGIHNEDRVKEVMSRWPQKRLIII